MADADPQSPDLKDLCDRLDTAIGRLARAPSFSKGMHVGPVLQIAGRVLCMEGGPAMLHQRAQVFDEAGLFAGTDWAYPEILQADIAVHTLRNGSPDEATMECLSELRLLAIADGSYPHASVSSEFAHQYLAQVLALNLDILFDSAGEAMRVRLGRLTDAVRAVLQELVQQIGYENMLDSLIDEIWRMLTQRPIRVDNIKEMITQIAVCTERGDIAASGNRGTDRLVSAVFGPTQATLEDPGLDFYLERLQSMDAQALQQEASGFARAMHDTGLVSAYHPVFLRFVLEESPDLLAAGLGLSSTGRDTYLCYKDLVHALIDAAVYPETPQSAYGLALMLERGVLYSPPVAPALWRQLGLDLCPAARHAIARAVGEERPAEVRLLAGVLGVLGLPFGVGQGNNPTCQAARAISMWAYNDPDYLLQMIVWAARDDDLLMHFEGQRLSSRELAASTPSVSPQDVDAVSAVLVPHLDRIYNAMGGLCMDRDDDFHRWVNPEFHGWWVGRGFQLAVDLATGNLKDFETFARNFYAYYHPLYNGNKPLIYPQPAGLAMTDTAGRFVGWHAITILRVTLDQEGVTRVYFFNPNNDSGQDLGNGAVVSTHGNGERFGESSLPVVEFLSRLYIFHYDLLEHPDPARAPADEIAEVEELARDSWAEGR